MSLDYYVYSGTRRMRCGFTTGSCAAMAAAAAAELLVTGAAPARERLVTPSGVAVEADVLRPVLEGGDAIDGAGGTAGSLGARAASCGIRKDAGDDVDVTDGLEIRARVRLMAPDGAGFPACPSGADAAGAPGIAKDVGIEIDGCLAEGRRIEIDGGVGVGRVTKPGLEQPVGAAAINSVPRRMIAERVRAVLDARGFERWGALVTVYVPQGEQVAEKTFNGHLGIEGGISILGTTGIVEPRSLRALRESVELEIRQVAALGNRNLVIVPGNYGSDYADSLPELAGVPRVACSNFMGAALDEAARSGIEQVLVVGHIGKLVKVAGGIMDTHSRVADARVEIVCAHAALAGAGRATAERIMAAPTTDACLDILEEEGGPGLLRAVCSSLTEAVGEHLDRRAAGAFKAGAIMFSKQRGELGRSAAVPEVLAAFGRARAAAATRAAARARAVADTRKAAGACSVLEARADSASRAAADPSNEKMDARKGEEHG